MAVHPLEEHLVGHAVVQVLARVDLETGVDALSVAIVEDRLPAPRKLVERRFDEPGRTLRKGIEERPRKRPGKGRHSRKPHVPRCPRRALQLVDRPFLPRRRIAVHLFGREAVEHLVVDRMGGDELPLQMGRQLGHGQSVLARGADDLVAIVLGVGRLLDVDQPGVPCRDLHALVAERGRPFADRIEGIERRRVPGELGKEYGRSLDRLHGRFSRFLSRSKPVARRRYCPCAAPARCGPECGEKWRMVAASPPTRPSRSVMTSCGAITPNRRPSRK